MVNIMARWLIMSLLIGVMPFGKTNTTNEKALHPFYVSVVDIKHNAKEKTAEVSIRIFTEDLENTLKKFGNTRIDMVKPANKAIVDKLLNDYIQQKLHIKLNDKAASMQYIGYEQQLESIWTYLEIKEMPTIKKVEINCSLLYDYQEKQTNIFHIKANGKEKSYKLDNPETNFTVSSYQ